MHDVILVGGGLANGLIAWRLRLQRPELRILLVEQGAVLGGNHTWSFYQKDLTPAQLAWLQPMVVRQWPGYEVRFPTHRRMLDTGCYSISSTRFHEVLTAALGESVMLDAAVSIVDRNTVQAGGQTLKARVVIDGRGHQASGHMRCAYQKFVGREVELAEPHGQTVPIIMDATVPQDGGYRFVYTLPFDARRMLVEDTYYSNQPDLDQAAVGDHIDAYIASRGWKVAGVVREETGVLPIALSGDIDAFWREKPGALPCSGLRAGLFHATTGYSLLYAVKLADLIAGMPALDAESVYQQTKAFSVQQWRRQGFMRLLNRMLFYASPPLQRYRILQRFYKLPQQLIERFYAARLTWFDQLRILTGKPPVPVLSAFRAAIETGKESSSKQS
ncbi:lycopene beta-cyclase CrtY [Noviherbaspirillum suwonense]|jgi:lycopene beta-cyclase|uniref:Lycopene beta-cyclase n=1 Tax=Noviherbaspirillum suwonense TaxID=1224511 RepID=A0ABY1PU64_9BURK|nr:lycopene beta-cyclase CrtY [Noviherbaspirillum suwonense]SMP43715.1 lycopene beta-cyclase [Noviherbaspirillum suwonense]